MINILKEDGFESIVKPNPISFPLLRHFYKHLLGMTRTLFKFHMLKKQKVSSLPITQKTESKPLMVSYLPLTESELESVSEDEQRTTNGPCERWFLTTKPRHWGFKELEGGNGNEEGEETAFKDGTGTKEGEIAIKNWKGKLALFSSPSSANKPCVSIQLPQR